MNEYIEVDVGNWNYLEININDVFFEKYSNFRVTKQVAVFNKYNGDYLGTISVEEFTKATGKDLNLYGDSK